MPNRAPGGAPARTPGLASVSIPVIAMNVPPGRAPGRRGRVVALGAAVVTVLAMVALTVPGVLPNVLAGPRSVLPWFPPHDCSPDTVVVVEVVVAPVVEAAVGEAVAGVQGARLRDGGCVRVQVRAQAPADTVSGSSVVPPGSAPQLWVSDSSLWAGQVHDWPITPAGSFGTTPVVLVSSSPTIAATGWSDAAPSWTAALDGSRPLAAPKMSADAAALLTMQALWQAGGANAAAERRLAATLLTLSRDHSTDPYQALLSVRRGGTGQTLVFSTEQAALAVNRDSTTPNLTAVYPAEGSPVLDFPILRLAPELRTPAERAATDAVAAALVGPAGQRAARRIGLRDPAAGSAPEGVGPASFRKLAALPAADQARFFARLASLTAPSRILAVVDVSPSMQARVDGTGLTRLQLAGRAAAYAGDQLADTSSAGLWVFAARLDGSKPYRQLSPMAPLGREDGATTHRDALRKQLLSLGPQIADGGTGLYLTALWAVRATRAGYDPRAVNSVVLFTAGKNENSDGLSLNGLLQRLRADTAAEPHRPVRIVGIGIGPDADLAALQAMAAATGGAAYRAQTPAELEQILYDALSHRS
jgi:Ca-activated chloride channel family protein